MDQQTRDIQPNTEASLPTTPTIPASADTGAHTNAQPSHPVSGVWLLAHRPATATARGYTHRYPLLWEHACVAQTRGGDIVSIIPDNHRSSATGAPEEHPTGTQYSVEVTNCGPYQDGTSLCGVSRTRGPMFLPGSLLGRDDDAPVNVGQETVYRPVFLTPRSTSNDPYLREPSASELGSGTLDFLQESLRNHAKDKRDE